MRIRSMHIENFRAIDSLDLDFGDLDGKALDLAVLAGPNGCGKTSVLEACLLALGAEKLLSRKMPTQDYSIRAVLQVKGHLVTVSRAPAQHEIIDEHGGKQPFKRAPVKFKTFFFSSWRAPKLVGSVGLSLGRGRRPGVSENNTLWRLKQKLVNITGSASFKSVDGTQAASAHVLFRRLNDAWKMFYPEREYTFEALAITHPPAKQPDGLSEVEDEESFDVFLQSPQQAAISIDELSSGEIEILSMLGMFVIANEPYEMIFIDEPELHLHPAWHRAVLPALRKVAPNTQFICATHSQDILDSVYSFQRFTLLPETDLRGGGRQTHQKAREVVE